MSNYLILIIAFILGQLGHTAANVYILQMNLPNVGYWVAVKLYVKKETAGFVLSVCAWAILMFIISDWVDFSVSRKDLLAKEVKTLQDKALIAFRTVSVVLGIFSQHVAYALFKKGKKAILDYEKKNQIEDK